MKGAKHLHWTSILIGSWVLVCVVASLIFGAGNPSKKESEIHLNMMNQEMDIALRVGGVVYSRYSNAKYGGALLFVNVNANSWSRGLAEKYRLVLLSRGWVQRTDGKGGLLFCKNGVRAKIGFASDVDSSRGQPRPVYGFSMTYSGETIKICQK